MTLVELILALLILTIIGGAIFSLMMASATTDRHRRNESTAAWEMDFAWHRINANGMGALPSTANGMTPTVTTDSNGQSRLTLIVPDVANNTTRTIVYYCTGTAAPFTLVESDPRYNSSGTPNPILHNVTNFTLTVDSSTTMKIWGRVTAAPSESWPITRHFCVQCRNF